MTRLIYTRAFDPRAFYAPHVARACTRARINPFDSKPTLNGKRTCHLWTSLRGSAGTAVFRYAVPRVSPQKEITKEKDLARSRKD